MLRVYAQSATASVPIIGASWLAPVADCPPLSRPHNLHYVGMPAAQGSLAPLSLRGLFYAHPSAFAVIRPHRLH